MEEQQETGVANAVEAIYRDLEYARSLIKRHTEPSDEHLDDDEAGGEGTTLTNYQRHRRIRSRSDAADRLDSSTGSGRSDDWSVVSGDEEPERLGMTSSPKRKSLAATTLQALHYALTSTGAPATSATQHGGSST
jgi:sterol 3beta-glucosyltransferase